MRFNSGCIRSITYGASIFTPGKVSGLPEVFSLENQLSPPIDQGNRGICVSTCMNDMVRYIYAGRPKETYNKSVDFYYDRRSDKKQDGMTPRNACEIAAYNGFISSYALVKSALAIKMALIANGPVMICLPVYNTEMSDFWRKPQGKNAIGYHAVTFVGYDDKLGEFKLRNSWGIQWGLGGYTVFPYTEQNYIREAWTIFN